MRRRPASRPESGHRQQPASSPEAHAPRQAAHPDVRCPKLGPHREGRLREPSPRPRAALLRNESRLQRDDPRRSAGSDGRTRRWTPSSRQTLRDDPRRSAAGSDDGLGQKSGGRAEEAEPTEEAEPKRGAGRIRTAEWRFCRPLPYHLATAPAYARWLRDRRSRPPKSGKPDSNRRPPPWQGGALPTELFPRQCCCSRFRRSVITDQDLPLRATISASAHGTRKVNSASAHGTRKAKSSGLAASRGRTARSLARPRLTLPARRGTFGLRRPSSAANPAGGPTSRNPDSPRSRTLAMRHKTFQPPPSPPRFPVDPSRRLVLRRRLLWDMKRGRLHASQMDHDLASS